MTTDYGHPIHGFGYRPDPEGHRYTSFAHHAAGALRAETLPASTNNILLAPPVWNQRRTGSCAGHGFACIETLTLATHGMALPSPVLPRVRYMLGRAIDRTDLSEKLEDVGSYPNSLARAAAQWGVVLEGEVDGGRTADSPDYSDYLEAHVNDEPKLGEIEKSLRRLFTDYKAIGDRASDKVLSFQKALAAGYGVGIAVEAGSMAFQGFSGQGVLDFTGSRPDHWVAIIDYRTNASGRPEFLLQNSWGPHWGMSGRAWVTERFVTEGCFNTLVASLGV